MGRIKSTSKPHKSLGVNFYRSTDETSYVTAAVRPDNRFNVKKQTEPTIAADLGSKATPRIDPAADATPYQDDYWTLTPIEESFRHGFWRSRRARIDRALQAAGISPRRLENFRQCGAQAHVWIAKDDGTVAIRANHCHDRFCQACGQARANRLQIALAKRVPQRKCLHVVLTLKSTPAPLGDQISRIYAAGSKLRAGKKWKRWVTGGMASLELTRSESTGLWHPHLHLLVHADWIPQAELSAEWLRVTGDSTIVHVSLVQNTAPAIREVTKYVTKPVHRSIDYDPAALVALIHALTGRHMLATFGEWRSDPLLADDPIDETREWIHWGSLHMLHTQAAAGDAWCRNALRFLSSLAPGRERRDPPGPPAPE